MKWLEPVDLVGAHFDAPGVGGDRGDLVTTQPRRRVQGESRSVAASEIFPRVPACLEVPSVNQNRVTRADLHTLGGDDFVKISFGDGVTGVERRDAAMSGDVEEHAAEHHVSAPLLDSVAVRSPCAVLGCAESVPHLTAVEDVGERIPLSSRLQRHHDDVVGIPEAFRRTPRQRVLLACHVVGSGGGGQKFRVLPKAARLWACIVVGKRQRDDSTSANLGHSGEDRFGAGEVHRTEFVVRAPPAPATVLGYVGLELCVELRFVTHDLSP